DRFYASTHRAPHLGTARAHPHALSLGPPRPALGDRRPHRLPQALPFGGYVSIASWNLTGDDVFTFVQQLRGHLKRPLLLIWDRFSGHRKAARLLHDLYGSRIHVEFLPAYAPDLNVVDHCWGHTKYGEMASFIPHDVATLANEVAGSLLAKHRRPDLL